MMMLEGMGRERTEGIPPLLSAGGIPSKKLVPVILL